jgi:acyl-coenzyme A thioesterase PaaI-like protein
MANWKGGFAPGSAEMHVRTIPACVALGMREYASESEGVGAWFDTGLPVCRSREGLPSRGAALILADQAGAVGTYCTFDAMSAMMTLDLRIDWHGAMPPARRLDVRIEDTLLQGAVSLVRGRMIADGSIVVGSLHAAYMVGSYPGGGSGKWNDEPLSASSSSAASFEQALRMEARGEEWHIAPDGEMVGARMVPAYHGGFVAAALEQASFERGGYRHAVNFEIRYLLPTRADQPLTIRTRVLRQGKLVSVIEADALQGEAQTCVATSRALYLEGAQTGQTLHMFPGETE